MAGRISCFREAALVVSQERESVYFISQSLLSPSLVFIHGRFLAT
jgi:hypothetical protein